MATFKIIDAQAITTSPTNSSAVNPDLTPDRYGTVVVTHSGSRLASNSTVAVHLQGSFDGTNYFDIESMKPSDTSYVNGTLTSWCRVVPLVAYVRVSVVNGGGLTYNAWVFE